MFAYCDYAATAPLRPEALEAMQPWLAEGYGNPSGMYALARDAKKAMTEARHEMAALLGVAAEELYFTSGGTEADNWALKGAMERQSAADRRHLAVSAIEHHAVLHSAEFLAKQGCELSLIPVDERGQVESKAAEAALRSDTALVSIMAANNEIGTILPVADLAAGVKARDPKILFHTDAVQAIGHIPFTITADMDMVTLSAHKFGGPKGVGALYIRRGLPLPPLLHGGGHERGRRSSTENVAGIVGMAAALKTSIARMDEESASLRASRDRLIDGVLSKVPYSFLTGDNGSKRLPGNASFVFEAVEGESLVLGLDMRGVCASSGSACSSASLDPSHVLLAIGLPHEVAHGSLRLSLGASTQTEVDFVIDTVAAVVARCRSMSPLWDGDKPTERFWKEG